MSTDQSQREPVGAGKFWDCLSQRAIGATLVTARDADGPAGFIGLSASHVSATPPTMLVSVDHRTGAWKTIMRARHFAVSFIGAADRATYDRFGPSSSIKGSDRFEPRLWAAMATGAPVFVDALGAFDCELANAVEQKGVSVLFGNVIACRRGGEGRPLVHFRGEYVSL